MGIITFFRLLFCKELILDNENLTSLVIKKQVKIEQLTTSLNKTEKEKSMWQQKAMVELITIPEIDYFCQHKYKQIPNIAYKYKRKIKNKNISLFLNEMITPNSFEIVKFKKGMREITNTLNMSKNVGNKVAQHLKWTSDDRNFGLTDYYSYPNETLILKEEDCESHAFVVSSLFPERFGVAYGFKDDGNGAYGHSFNVFVHNASLYILDTVTDSAHTELYKENSKYKIHYIITEKNTYEIDGSVPFGSIAKI